MANSSIISFVFVWFFFSLVWEKCQVQSVPALYVFGASQVDPGNNNNSPTYAKTNYAPYGIDFPTGVNGRSTNGYTTADLIALSLGLNPPPAVKLLDTSTFTICEGFNYASASAGILPESGFKGSLSMGEQVGLFKKTVEEYLPVHLTKENIAEHLSKSIFLSYMGANDYSLNFLKKKNSGQAPDEEAFATSLIEKYGTQLQDLYNLGARKFVVFNIEALGCSPINVNEHKPFNSKCVEELNLMVKKFNDKLPLRLQQLAHALPGSIFVLGKNYEHVLNLVGNPRIYGLSDASNPCCVTTRFGTCEANKPPCPDRNTHVFFDAYHQTEASNKILAQTCFRGVGGCVPINIQELAKQ